MPSSLIDESSWATPSFAPFARSAIAFEVRRRAAVLLRDSVSMDEAFDLHSAWDVRRAREAADAGARADARAAPGTAALAEMVAGHSGGPAALSPAPAAAPVALALAVPLAYAAPLSPTPTHSIPTPHPAYLPATTRRWAAGLAVASHSLGP